MGMKTWVMVLMGAFAINLYLKSSRQKGLGDAGTGRALEGESTDDEMAGAITPAATGTGTVTRLREADKGGAFGGLGSSQGDGGSHDDLLTQSADEIKPGLPDFQRGA
jgi:hypothetical protein